MDRLLHDSVFLAHLVVTVPAALAEELVNQGIQRVLLGHTPHGNCPTGRGPVVLYIAHAYCSDQKHSRPDRCDGGHILF